MKTFFQEGRMRIYDLSALFYYYLGRRVKKAVYGYAAGAWTLSEERLFVYDGWNLVEEIDRQGGTETSRYFVWGQDLSQSLQGAGGIGGLVAEVDAAGGSGGSSLTYYSCYDGNGNVGQVVNGADGTIAAAYEYDPYGKVLKADGAYAGENPFRFSTKYADDETGLVYYGYRYYSSELGRWLCRDPLEEAIKKDNYKVKKAGKSDQNLYAFVVNQSVNKIDSLGLIKWEGTAVGGTLFTAGLNIFTLKSECVDGEYGIVKVVFAGPGLGIGLDFSGTKSDVNIEDPFLYINFSSFEPDGFIASAGLSWPPTAAQKLGQKLVTDDDIPHGAGCGVIRLGNAWGIGCGPLWGINIGAGILYGSSTVWSSEKKCCNDKK